MSEWIKCTDEMPPDVSVPLSIADKRVLLWNLECHDIELGVWDSDVDWYWVDSYDRQVIKKMITHWMPLPAPPEPDPLPLEGMA